MRRAKLQLAYDRSKPDEEKVWSILNDLGHKRSDTIQLLVEYVIRRFGDDVLRKDRLDSLKDTLNREVEDYYLCRMLVLGNGMQEVPAELSARMQTISDVIGQNSSAAKEQTEVAHSESQEDPNSVSHVVMQTEGAVSTILPGQQLSIAGTGGWDSDEESPDDMRRGILDFLSNGFYEQT